MRLRLAWSSRALARWRRRDGYSGHRHHYHKPLCDGLLGNCTYVAHNRYAYRWRYYHHRHNRYRRYGSDYSSYAYPGARERMDHGLQCHARRRVIGEVKSCAPARNAPPTTPGWIGPLRPRRAFQDLNYAKDVRHNCGPSSTTTILKRTFFRCSIEATPCRAPLEIPRGSSASTRTTRPTKTKGRTGDGRRGPACALQQRSRMLRYARPRRLWAQLRLGPGH